jgi:DAK2 domain fusion protein YloV
MVTQEPALAQQSTWDGRRWRAAFLGGTARLEQHREAVNDLNVFPVPDGDTGTNMLLTMRAALAGIDPAADEAAAIGKQAARGALMGARGNSGVILSQIIAGMARELEGHRESNAQTMAQALKEAAEAAYGAVAQPVEGTMLTVAREAGRAAEQAAEESHDVATTLRRATTAAAEAVRKTRYQLKVLEEAGVVDAGGEGYRLILEGMLLAETDGIEVSLGDAAAPVAPAMAPMAGSMMGDGDADGEGWGYCTQFLITGRDLDMDHIHQTIQSLADWSVVVGDSEVIRVHGHTEDPGQMLSAMVESGRLADIHIEDMDLQVLEREARLAQGPADTEVADETAPPVPLATVAVTAGEGLVAVLRSLGVSKIVMGGQTMNPSTEELLAACTAANASQVLILPNNKNVILAAEQVSQLVPDDMGVTIVPTKTVVQGIAAQLAFNGEDSPDENAAAMTEAAQAVCTIELTYAVRDSTSGNLAVREGEAIALVDDMLVAHGADQISALRGALDTLDTDDYEVVSVYPGADAEPDTTDTLVAQLEEWLPLAEIEVTPGGQPHYHYFIGLE